MELPELFPIARYRFQFSVTENLHFPDYAGSMLRGAFGRALRKISCMTKQPDCKECPLYRTCPYPAILKHRHRKIISYRNLAKCRTVILLNH